MSTSDHAADNRGCAPEIRAIFEGEDPVFAVDVPELQEWLIADGYKAADLADVFSITSGAVVAVSSHASTVGFALKSQPGVRKVHLVQSVLTDEPETVSYAVRQFLSSDPIASTNRQFDASQQVRSTNGEFRFLGDGTELEVRSVGKARMFRLDDPIIKPGECISVHAFFETGLANLRADEQSAFVINGHCHASGMLATRDAQLRQYDEPPEWQARRDLVAHHGADIRIENNMLISLEVAGQDISDEICDQTRDFGRRLTECSIGTNDRVGPNVDWTRNSLMNEGAQGIHVGLGRPVDGMHFDFICPDVRLVTDHAATADD